MSCVLFPNSANLIPKGHLARSGDIFDSQDWEVGVRGIEQVEARDAPKQPATHRTASNNTHELVQTSVVFPLPPPPLPAGKPGLGPGNFTSATECKQ